MPSLLRKLLFIRNRLNPFTRRKTELDDGVRGIGGNFIEQIWTADFSKGNHAYFAIKSDFLYDANLRKNQFYSGYSFVLALKKSSCLAWSEAPAHYYRDTRISASLRIDARGGYGAAGLFFRMVDEGTYYSFLVSSKGYFRLDVMRNGMPLPLVAWTEIPLFSGESLRSDESIDFSLIVCGSRIVILIRGRWAAEVSDTSLPEGCLAFAAASYEVASPESAYTLEAFLHSLTVDSRPVEVSTFYEKWHNSPDIDSAARLHLAETFTAMNQHQAALIQIRKIWELPGQRKTQRELLLAARLSQVLGLTRDAEDYARECFQLDEASSEGKEAVTELAKILYAEGRYRDLAKHCTKALKTKKDDPVLRVFQGHAYWNIKDYEKAARAYDAAFALDPENGIPAKNAANVYDMMGRKEDALQRYIDAGRAFLKSGSYNDLGLLVPTLLSLGKDHAQAHSLAGKWAFAVEDWNMADTEFKQAERLRTTGSPTLEKDGAQVFLEALLLIRLGKRREALPLLKEAAALEKHFPLFHFRVAETHFLLDADPDNPAMLSSLNTALSLLEKDALGKSSSVSTQSDDGISGWVSNFAAQIALRKNDLPAAARYLETALRLLGNVPAVLANRGLLFFMEGSLDKALAALASDAQNDPEGIMANCAGNILVHAERFSEADKYYRKALAASPNNAGYLYNHALCLIEQGLFGEADDCLARACALEPSPSLFETISFVAVKKGKYPEAEQACRSALAIEANHAPSLISLGWILLTLGRISEAGEIINRLIKLDLRADLAKGREELCTRRDDLLYRRIECANFRHNGDELSQGCGHSWKVLKDLPPVPPFRLIDMPPDDLPAGSCPECGKTFCIGCAKQHLDEQGRFMCQSCSRSLKLINEGLKMMIREWVEQAAGDHDNGETVQ